MLSCFFTEKNAKSIAIKLISQSKYAEWLQKQSATTQQWLAAIQFRADPGQFSIVADGQGNIAYVLFCIPDVFSMWSIGHLPANLPEGQYYLETNDEHYWNYALAWGLGAYQFLRYKKSTRNMAMLFLPEENKKIQAVIKSIYGVRDWINTPTDDLGPSEFATIAAQIAEQFNAQFSEIVGDDLLTQNFPAIFTVGRASDDPARLIDIRWGNATHPKVTLVGKGVCFDTGGLDLKPSAYMQLMKKDMGGAAHVLGLASMIMQAQLPICLRVLIPVLENAVSGNAYRPGDVIKSRKGLTIEIGNTDAEGRVILADAITEAVSETPDLLIDIATLTGAARVALGPDVPVMFCNQDQLAEAVRQHGENQQDPVWRLPLYAPYRDYLNSTIADINNNPSEAYGGAITAALFLKEFVPDNIPWLHFDVMAWNLRTRPGRPQGGEAMGLRALFAYLQEQYG